MFILNLAFQRTSSTSKYQEQRERLERYLNSDVMDKIQEIQLDDTEIGSLKAIILLNPDSRGLHYPEQVLAIREKLYASLEAYCKVGASRDHLYSLLVADGGTALFSVNSKL